MRRVERGVAGSVFWTLKGVIGTSLVVQWLRITFQCRGHGLGPRSGNQEPTCHAAKKKKKTPSI